MATACHNKESFDATGTFEATEIVVSSEANGKILELNVTEGNQLDANTVVGNIDSVQLFLRKKQLQNTIRAVESRRPDIKKQIAVLEQQITSQKFEKQRVENLLQANAANKKQLDDITAHIALLEKQLEAQRSSLEITSTGINEDVATLAIQIEQLDDQLNKCRIVNPMQGTVLAKYAEAGELAMQGKALYRIADVQNMTLRAYITSAQLSQVKLGQEVTVLADFGAETRSYTGKITWISNKSEFTPKTIQTKDERANLVYAIKIAVTNDGFLKIGMYGQVNF
jgi:HlyD family secretion protein